MSANMIAKCSADWTAWMMPRAMSFEAMNGGPLRSERVSRKRPGMEAACLSVAEAEGRFALLAASIAAL